MDPQLKLVERYLKAIRRRDAEAMAACRDPRFELDFVHGDAFRERPRDAYETARFWPSLFTAFPRLEYEVLRTVAAPDLIVTQWLFTGINDGPLHPPLFSPAEDGELPARGRAVRLRGCSVYDLEGDRLRRETLYMDYATLLVELGIGR